MNSYNENLRSTVVSTLQDQEMEQKKEQAKKNASMFTLYYAEGATITAAEKLEAAKDVLNKKTEVKKQSVINSNISNNLLSSAAQADQYLKQSVSNTAVCAANVQVAANAIVKLASDIGSIYGIANAADYDGAIFKQADEVRKLLDKTAYEAEQTSQFAMEASMAASEVSSSTVLDKAKVTNGAMNDVLKITSDEFTAATAVVNSDNAALASASAAEKIAEGNFEDMAIDYKASKNAYAFTNHDLNMDLKVPKKNLTPISFNVQFRPLEAAFEKVKSIYYPVQDYYIMVVKDSQKTIFSTANAESLVQNNLYKRFVRIPFPFVVNKDDAKKEAKKHHTYHPKVDYEVIYQTMLDVDGKSTYVLQDSDGKEIALGEKYVVFIMANFLEDYKKKLNDYSDFLSAPSSSFTLGHKLKAVDGSSIRMVPPAAEKDGKTDSAKPAINYALSFPVAENIEYADAVEYRCILLPKSNKLAGEMLSKESFDEFNHEVQELEAIANKFDPKIAELEGEWYNLQSSVEGLTSNKEGLEADIQKIMEDSTLTPKEKQQKIEPYQNQLDNTNIEIDERTAKMDKVAKTLKDTEEKKGAEIAAIYTAIQSTIGFMFNLKLAEQVPAGNYIPAQRPQGAPAKTTKKTNEDEYPVVNWTVNIGANATDNFGNPLVPGDYVPVIVSYSTAKEENISMFTNSWSGYHKSPVLTIK